MIMAPVGVAGVAARREKTEKGAARTCKNRNYEYVTSGTKGCPG